MLSENFSEYEDSLGNLVIKKTRENDRLKLDLDENFQSARAEVSKFAEIREEENQTLREQVSGYERQVQELLDEKRALLSIEGDVESRETENISLRGKLKNYETSFNHYIKTKEDEMNKLRSKLERSYADIDDLRVKLSEATDGQLQIL